MEPGRDDKGILYGDLEYDEGFSCTVLSHVTPVLFPCVNCGTIELHVIFEQPTGPAIKLIFVRKPLVSLMKAYGLVCNECASIGIGGGSKQMLTKLESRIVPHEICRALDSFLEAVPGSQPAYSPGFTEFILSMYDDIDMAYIASVLSVYRRES